MAPNPPPIHEVVTLLEAEYSSSTPSTPLDPEANGAAWAPARRRCRWRWRVTVESPRGILILASLVKFAVVLSGMMIMLPLFRVLEDGFCHRHFGDTSPGFIEEKKCKVPEVQQGLAYLMGWILVVTAVIGEFGGFDRFVTLGD